MLQHSIILFDGICNLCNRAVQFIIKRDRKNHFVFASLQSDQGQKLLSEHLLCTNEFKSLVLIENGKVYKKSTAALRIARKLNGLWPLLYGFILIPKLFRDGIYNQVAKNRYKWFGKRDECMVTTTQLKARFLN